MPNRALFPVCVVLAVSLGSESLAISDDANPWLAIENAVCVSHRGVDYAVPVGAPVELTEVQWRGMSDRFPMHCFLAGRIGADVFEIRLPTDWNRQLYDHALRTAGDESGSLAGALGQGYAVLFTAPTEAARRLLQATVDHQYRELGSAD